MTHVDEIKCKERENTQKKEGIRGRVWNIDPKDVNCGE